MNDKSYSILNVTPRFLTCIVFLWLVGLSVNLDAEITEIPASASFKFQYDDQTYIAELTKYRTANSNTRILFDFGDRVEQIENVQDGSYVGRVIGNPQFRVHASITKDGWHSIVYRPSMDPIVIQPKSRQKSSVGNKQSFSNLDSSNYEIFQHSPEWDCCPNPGCCKDQHSEELTDILRQTNGKQIDSEFENRKTRSHGDVFARGTGSVFEFELGVDISYTAWINRYGSNMSNVSAQMDLLIMRLDETWLQSAMVKHVIGTVIVRVNQSSDPYQGFGATSVPMIEAFRSRWNSNPGNENGGTHDLAVMHHGNGGGGLGYVGQIGEGSRYGLAGANTTLGWLGFIHHEIGHIWGLGHSHGRQELNPSGNQFGIMWVGPHERATTDEATRIIQERDESSSGGVNIDASVVAVPPYGNRDDVLIGGDKPVTIDVLANDFDSNGDALTLTLLDEVSDLGASLSLSFGTGPAGRDEILYSPPPSGANGDYFHYRIVDSTGLTSWGYVTIESSSVDVDLNSLRYFYDLGPVGSIVFDENEDPYVLLSEFAAGDVFFEQTVESVDYGGSSGQNTINRDGLFRSDGATVIMEHKVVNGQYEVLVTVGDAEQPLDNVTLGAEGQTFITNVDRSAGEIANESFDVEVSDGSLSLEIGDTGGSSNRWMATRIILTRTNASPEARDDVYSNLIGNILTVGTADGLLANDTDVEDEALAVNPEPVTDVKYGDLILFSSGSFQYTAGTEFPGSDTFSYEVTDEQGLSATANVTIVAQNRTSVVVANSIADLQLIAGNGGQDRFEMVLGDSNGPRVYLTRFDTTVIEPFLNDDFRLLSAEVLLTEQPERDELNGNDSAHIESYFLNTVENRFWDYNDLENLDEFQNGVLGWFGNTLARPGRFGGEGNGGNSNVDLRADIDNINLGVASAQLNFSIGIDDNVAINLLNGSGLTILDIESILEDWIAGDNAGLGFIDRNSGPFVQRFFQSGNVSAGNPVNSTINGEISGSALAQDGETGNGLGGPQLRLIFQDLTPVLIGDINGDGFIDLLDVEPFVNTINQGDYSVAADINQDGVINLLDVAPFVELILDQ